MLSESWRWWVEYYWLLREMFVLCIINIVMYLVNRYVLQSWLIKWAIKLNNFVLKYVLMQEIKSHDLTPFLAQHKNIEVQNMLDELCC